MGPIVLKSISLAITVFEGDVVLGILQKGFMESDSSVEAFGI